MASTTLVTFLVRTPPTTRSVTLLGSWDNFDRPYPMRRDKQLGAEHWSGCHRFSNIICDGGIRSPGPPREGGLKMGCTYWYYYRLDDDIDFHNSAEPATTQCPMLPGQLVNVLQVPLAFSGTRPRNTSTSSTNSELRTMEPADKFLNPRAVPQPKLARIQTSPTLLQRAASSENIRDMSPMSVLSRKPASQPTSTTSSKAERLPRKASQDALHRTNTPMVNRPSGFLGSLRALKSQTAAPPDTVTDGRRERSTDWTPSGSRQWNQPHRNSSRGRSAGSTRSAEDTHGINNDLVLRRPLIKPDGTAELFVPNSFHQHREQRSRSRTPSSLRNSLVFDDALDSNFADIESCKHQRLETVREVASAQITPIADIPQSKIAIKAATKDQSRDVDLEKRLPTLPNTPSSAYPPSPTVRLSLEMANLQSHFSCTTIDSDATSQLSAHDEDFRFSAWSSVNNASAPKSASMISFIEDDPMSPASVRRVAQHSLETASDQRKAMTETDLPLTLSCSTISSTTSSSLSTSPLEAHYPELGQTPTDIHHTQHKNALNSFQHYSLPADEHGSDITLKLARELSQESIQIQDPPRVGVHRQDSIGHNRTSIGHSSAMQQLLCELSYLGEMIQQR